MGRNIHNRFLEKQRRKEERAAAKNRRRSIAQKFENSLDAKDFSELQGMTFGQKINFMMTNAWILNRWYEKLLLGVLLFLSVWKVLNLFGFFTGC